MSEISVVDTQTWKREVTNTWLTHVKLSDDKVVTGEAYNRLDAVFDARQKVKEYVDSLTPKTEPTSPKLDSKTGKWTISTDDPRIAGISRRESVNKESLASDLCEQEKVMTGLIEKAKRSGIDHRLIAMANTDFERGFMALEKALASK